MTALRRRIVFARFVKEFECLLTQGFTMGKAFAMAHSNFKFYHPWAIDVLEAVIREEFQDLASESESV